MQIYPDILGTDAVSDSRQMILDRENSIKSSFSGPRAPTVTAEDVGCIWYCTADSNFYGLFSIDEDGSNPVWQKLVTPTKLNVMDLGTPTTETLYVDLEGAPCEAKKDMFVLVEHTILPVENYEITNNGMRVTFVSPIPAGLKLEIRWFVQEVIGRDGATFVPSIVNNVLTWDNDQGLVNPPDLDFNANLTEIENFANEQIVAIKDNSDAEIAKINNTGSTQVATVQSNGASQVNLIKQTAQEYINTMDGKATEASNSATEAAESAEAAAASAASIDADNIVHKTGDETIADVKTFTRVIKSNNNLALESKTNLTTFEKPVETPTENKVIGRINFLSSDNSLSMGHILTYRTTTNAVVTQISARQSIDGVQKSGTLEVGVSKDGIAYVNGPTPADSANNTNMPTTGWVRKLFALLTGNNTFSGTNTFTSSMFMQSGNDMSYCVRSLNADNTQSTQDVQTLGAFRNIDKNGKIIGDIRFSRGTNGAVTSAMVARNYASDANGVSAVISCGVDKDGNIITTAPTPATSDNSTKIATTQFVNNVLSANKETFVGWGIPNYSAGVDIFSSVTTGYTVPKKGVVMVYTLPAANACQITINGVVVVNKAGTGGSYAIAATLPVDKNDVVKVSFASGGSIKFFPFKGV